MRTIRLYTPQPLYCDEILKLENKTAHHLIKVLRTKTGTGVVLFNGDGFDYNATLIETDPKNTTLSIDRVVDTANESPLNITLLQGLSRGDRMEVSIQKSVELGVKRIIPVTCERSNYAVKADRIKKKVEHWQQIIISACEQSGRATIPQLIDIHTYADAIKLYGDHLKIILSTDSTDTLSNLNPSEKNICLFIGPEGGLTPEEIKLATQNAYKEIKFGPRILRTETAGPAVISAIQALWGDFL